MSDQNITPERTFESVALAAETTSGLDAMFGVKSANDSNIVGIELDTSGNLVDAWGTGNEVNVATLEQIQYDNNIGTAAPLDTTTPAANADTFEAPARVSGLDCM